MSRVSSGSVLVRLSWFRLACVGLELVRVIQTGLGWVGMSMSWLGFGQGGLGKVGFG